jgi:hypothetical protein
LRARYTRAAARVRAWLFRLALRQHLRAGVPVCQDDWLEPRDPEPREREIMAALRQGVLAHREPRETVALLRARGYTGKEIWDAMRRAVRASSDAHVLKGWVRKCRG